MTLSEARETLDWYSKLPCPSWRELERLEKEVAMLERMANDNWPEELQRTPQPDVAVGMAFIYACLALPVLGAVAGVVWAVVKWRG